MVKNVQVFLDVVKYVEVVSKILDDYFIYPKVVHKDTRWPCLHFSIVLTSTDISGLTSKSLQISTVLVSMSVYN
jgi:hypothetical protein